MYATPGVYFQSIDRSRPAIAPLRTDIAGFAGYAERGPLGVAVRVGSWRQFESQFGGPLAHAHLAYAVRGFFDNGGAVCYVARVADPDVARAARVTLPGADGLPSLTLWASHGLVADPNTASLLTAGGSPVRLESPGAWGTRLALSVVSGGLGSTRAVGPQPEDGTSSFVEGLSGFQVGSIVRVSQGGAVAPSYRRVVAIAPIQRELVWDQPLSGLDLTGAIRFETVEFGLLVHLDGQIVERHANLSLSETHDRYVVTILQANSAFVDVAAEPGDALSPDRWPAPADRAPLVGGLDGLATVRPDDWLAGLDALAAVDEISLLAAPDVVLRAQATAPTLRRPPRPVSCEVLEAPPAGRLRGLVLERGATGDVPLAGVQVQFLEGASQATSGPDGTFLLEALPPGRVTLLLTRDGYVDTEVTAEARLVPPAEPLRFFLAPITQPAALSLDEIFDVQAAMVGQGEAGLYRVALLDPPPEMLGIEEIQTWRARWDSPFAALYYPWLVVTDPGGGGAVRTIPPSGHVAGLVARTDLAQGVHRAPANEVLSGVRALSEPVDDVRQGILNPQGINCLRVLPGRGIRVYGARTLSSAAEWRYLNVRRLVLMIEEAIEDAHQWAVFEPNNAVLRQALTFSLGSFLETLWRQGMLAGTRREAAFQVRCGPDNNPPATVDAGQIIAEIAVAPTIPFEFVIFRLGRTVEAVEVTE